MIQAAFLASLAMHALILCLNPPDGPARPRAEKLFLDQFRLPALTVQLERTTRPTALKSVPPPLLPRTDEPQSEPAEANPPLAYQDEGMIAATPDLSAYRERNELTAPPRPATDPQLPVPDQSVEGRAKLTLLVNESGSVAAAIPDEFTLPAEYLNLLQRAFLAMEFVPGRIGDQAVKSRYSVEITLSLLPSFVIDKVAQ